MKKIFYYLKPHVPRMTLGLSIKFLGTIMDLLLPYILAYMIDDIVPTKNVPFILIWGGVMLFCSVLAVVTNIVANRMAARVARNTTEALRHDLFSKISYLSCAQIDEFTIPSLESRLTSDTYNIHQMIGMMQRMGVRAPILLLGGILVTFTLEPVLTLVLVCVLPFIGYIVWRVSKKGIPLYTQLQKAVDNMVRTVRENASGIRVIKALSKTEYERKRFADANANVVEKETKAGVTMALTNPMMNLFLNLGLTLVIVVGAFRVNAGVTQAGKIIAFLSYFTIILNAMLSVTRIFVMYSKGSASAGRISLVLDAPADLERRAAAAEPADAHIVFDHVSFSYHKRKENLTDVSFSLKRGQTLGIIGATGCGKSTLINLLMRLYDADKGRILIDGRSVESIDPAELHEMFGVVFQNDILFADTIANNIDFGRGLDKEQIEAAVKHAQASEFIDALPDGLDHMLTTRGTNVSGGQKQRLLLARAFAGKPDILILDDSSSALDYKTDAKLRQEIAAHYQDTTTVIVAQRVSSIKHADHILVLEDGLVIGSGAHDELMETCETYRDISRTQMGGGQVA